MWTDCELSWMQREFFDEMRLSFAFSATRVESDPMEWPRPRTLKALWRQMRAIVGYEYRKASGTLRRHSDPRQHAIITGLTS